MKMPSTEYRMPNAEPCAARMPCRSHDTSGVAIRRAGFTLVELIVAMGLLVGLMTMVGAIFKIAGDTASQGTATMSVYRYLRSVRQVIQQDLENFDPTNGALAIYGWEQLAYATQSDRESGRVLDGLPRKMAGGAMNSYRPPLDYHRADVFMLTTHTESQPYAYRPNKPTDPVPTGTAQIIVYGHADQGRLDPGNDPRTNDDRWEQDSSGEPIMLRIAKGKQPIAALGIEVGDGISDLPASKWHLARRLAVLSNETTFKPPTPLKPDGVRYRLSSADRLKLYRLGEDSAGEGRPSGDFFQEFDLNAALDMWESNAFGQPDIPNEWYYDSAVFKDNRTAIIASPTAGQQQRMASHFLPGCTEFKVEVTFDTPEMIFDDATTFGPDPQPPTNWFTVPSGRRLEWVRGKPVGQIADSDNATRPGFKALWKDVIDFAYGTAGASTYNLTDLSLAPNPANPPFPTAIRITIWVMDENESLYNPRFDPKTGQRISDVGIKEVIVHKF